MDKFNLCYWLDNDKIQASETFVPQPPVDKPCQVMHSKIVEQCKLTNPINSAGWLGTDIDVLSNTTDARLINQIAGYMGTPSSEPSHDTLSDAQIAQLVIPRGVNYSDVQSLVSSVD